MANKKKCHHIVLVIIVVIVVVLEIVSWLCAVPRPKIIRSAWVACGCFGSVLACGCLWSLGLSGCQWLPHERNHFLQAAYFPFSLHFRGVHRGHEDRGAEQFTIALGARTCPPVVHSAAAAATIQQEGDCGSHTPDLGQVVGSVPSLSRSGKRCTMWSLAPPSWLLRVSR